jgi:TRAP-type transport system periplasmic protein
MKQDQVAPILYPAVIRLLFSHPNFLETEEVTNMKMRLLLLVVLVGSITLACSVWAAEPVKLKFASYEAPQGAIVKDVIAVWAERVNKEGKGILEIEVFSGGALGRDPLQQLKLLTDGVADIAQIPNPYHPGRFVDDTVLNVPFVAETMLESSLALFRMYGKGMLRGYEDIVVLALFGQPQYNIHGTSPITMPQDMKGKKIRTAGKMQHSLVEACGGTPVAVPISSVAESLNTGVVHATISEWHGMAAWRINDVAKYHCLVPFGCGSLSFSMNKKKYDSLPANAKALLDKHKGEPLVRLTAQGWGTSADEVLEKTKKDPKHTVVVPSLDQLKPWKAAFDPAIEAWKKENSKGEELLKAYMDEVAKIRGKK